MRSRPTSSPSFRSRRASRSWPGPAARFKAILPSLAVVGEPFRLAIVAEDIWGNPTAIGERPLTLVSSVPIRNLPADDHGEAGRRPARPRESRRRRAGDVELRLTDESGAELARANPMRVVARAPLRRYWGDLHGQSGETVGTNPARSYFAYARDKAFVDIVGHQGNDFQITDAFWHELNRLTAEFDVPGRFVCVPGYEWSGNTGMGGDRNIFYRREGRPIFRSSRILVDGQDPTNADCYTAQDLFGALAGEDAVVIAHVGGRYADIKLAHDGKLERAVEVHSTWGTFEWLLHDAFEQGLSRRRRVPQRRPQGPAGRDAARRIDLRGDRRAHLLPDAGADARRAVRGAARSAATTARPARGSASISRAGSMRR